MHNRIKLKTWSRDDSRSISLYLEEKKITASIYDSNGKIEYQVPSYDINLPREIIKNASLPILSYYLKDTHVSLRVRSDGSIGVYINPGLKGGGFWDSMACGVAIVTGFLLVSETNNTWTLVMAAGLINSGIKGMWHSVQTESNFDKKFQRQVGGNFAYGVGVGVTGELAASINPTNMHSDFLSIAKIMINTIGGALSQALASIIIHGVIKRSKILIGALTGGIGSIFSLMSTDHMVVVNKICEEKYNEIADFESKMTVFGNAAIFHVLNAAKKGKSNNSDGEQKKCIAESEDLDRNINNKSSENSEVITALEDNIRKLAAIKKEKELENERLRKKLGKTNSGSGNTALVQLSTNSLVETINDIPVVTGTKHETSVDIRGNKSVLFQLKESNVEKQSLLVAMSETHTNAVMTLDETSRMIDAHQNGKR